MKLHPALQIVTGVLLAVLVVFVLAETRNAFAERDVIGKAVRDRDTITVSGQARVSATPDLAKVDVGIFSEAATVAAVQQDSTKKMNAVIAAIKGLGIDERDIQTSNYNLQPKIDWSNGNQHIIGYTLSQTVNVKARALEKVGQVIEKAVAEGANQVYGVQFTIDDPTSIQDEARLKAIQDAREKADALADALDLKILRVVTFAENSGGLPVPYPYGIGGDAALEKAVAPSLEPGALDVNMAVSVTFEVR